MCTVKVFIVGNSEWLNLNAMQTIDREFHKESKGKAKLIFDQSKPLDIDDFNISSYDIIAVDDAIVPTECGRAIMGIDIPTVIFSDLEKRTLDKEPRILPAVMRHAIARGNLRDKIDSTTRQIEDTSRMLAFAAN